MIFRFAYLIMAIAYFGQTWVPATDNDTTPLGSATPHAIVPPGSMTSGQVVLVFVTARNTTAPAVSNTGGQTWTSQTANSNGLACIGNLFSCVFNGTWSANPSFTTGSTADGVCLYMVVLDGVHSTVFDVSPVALDLASGTSKTLTGFNTGIDGAWACFIWGEPDDNVLSGQDSGWTGFNGSTGTLNDHVGNQGGGDIGLFLSKKTQVVAGATGNNVVALNTNDVGAGFYFSLKPKAALTQNLSDSITLSDSKTNSLDKVISDSITLSDGRSAENSFVRTLADNIALSDNRSREISRPLADNIVLSELFSSEKFINKSLADNIILSDENNRVLTFARSLSDNITLSDDSTPVSSFNQQLSDSITLSDGRVYNLGKQLTDNIILSDGRVINLGKALSDSMSLSDESTYQKFINKALADNIALSDEAGKAVLFNRSLSDNIILSDNQTKISGFNRTVSDNITLSDNSIKVTSYNRSIGDNINLSDNNARATGFNKQLADNIVLADNFLWEFAGSGYSMYAGEHRIIKIYIGGTEVSAAYLGEINL